MEDKAEKKQENVKVDLDYILVNEIGQFGRFQLWNVLLIAIPVIFSATMSEYIFSNARLTTRCQIPECDGSYPEITPDWLLNAIPGNSLTDFDECNRYASANFTEPTGQVCPAVLFNRDVIVSCESYVHDRTNSAVYDFGIECQEWLRALAGTLSSVGTLLVLPITGYISDRYGRVIALTINCFNIGLTGLIRAFSINYEMYLALQLIQTTIGAGAFSSAYILATEMAGPKYRVMTGITMNSLFATGQVIMGFVAWGVPEWRTFNIVLFAPQLLTLSYFWVLTESIRWLLSKQKFNEAREILHKAAKINKKTLKDETVDALVSQCVADIVAADKVKDPSEPNLIMQIIKSPIMLRRCCTTPIWWITVTFVYYGLSINAVGLAGNMYLNYIFVCAIEIPGYWLSVLLLDRIGRKITLSCAYMICAACNIGFAFTPNTLPTLSLILYLVGKFAISVVFAGVYLYTSELYPTKYRHNLLAFSSMIGRIGSICAPLTPALMIYWEGIPSAMFAAMAFISGLLVLTTPETLGNKMPDTIEEAEAIGRKL